MFTLNAPAGMLQFEARSGNPYTVSSGVINVPLNDLIDALAAGFTVAGPYRLPVGNFGGRVVTAASGGLVQMGQFDFIIEMNLASPAAVSVIPVNPLPFQPYTVKDGAGNASQYPITVTPSTGTIDGLPFVEINENRGAVSFYFNGTNLSTIP